MSFNEIKESLLELDPQRILDNVRIDDNCDCWIWAKSFTTPGYGQIWYKGKRYDSHRYSYMCFKGIIPKGYLVRHLCHNRSCCNPEHLEVGTHLDNYNDSREMYTDLFYSKRKSYIIKGVDYKGVRDASKCTGLSQETIIKYTDPVTRVFNVDCIEKSVK